MAFSRLLRNFSHESRRQPSVEKEIHDFMKKSVKCQTLYANLEGVYGRRVISVEDNDTLENFVYCTMYYNRHNIWDTDRDSSIGQHVRTIVDRIILISKNFNTNGKIHLGVVWVYYFSYEDKAQKATPVFKIYRNESGNDVMFLDVSLNVYRNWINYLDSAEFPRAFLCLPQNGEYTFLKKDEEKKLDLTYQIVEDSLVKKSVESTASFLPCSQVVFQELRCIMRSITKKSLQELKAICHILADIIIGKKELLFNCIMFGFLVWLKMKESGMELFKVLKFISMESLMFLNTSVMDLCLDSFSTNLFSSFKLTNILGFENVLKAKETLGCCSSDAYTLVELFKKPEKNWEAILRCICALFRSASPILDAVLKVVPLPPTLRYIFLMLKSFSKICGNFFLTSEVGRNNTLLNIEKKMNGREIISARDVNKLSNENNIENIQILGRPKEKHERFQFICDRPCENFFMNYLCLEKTCGEEVHDLFFEKIEQKVQSVKKPTFTSSVLFMGELERCGIFLIPSDSLANLNFNMKQILKEDFSFKIDEISVYKVVLTSGKVAGTLYFPLDFCCVGLFSIEAIKKQEE